MTYSWQFQHINDTKYALCCQLSQCCFQVEYWWAGTKWMSLGNQHYWTPSSYPVIHKYLMHPAGWCLYATRYCSGFLKLVNYSNTKHQARYKCHCQLLKKMSRNICQGDTEKCLLIMIEEYQTERIFVGTGRKIETSLVLWKTVLQRETADFLKVDNLVPLKLFYVLILNGIGLNGEAFYISTLTKLQVKSLVA